MENSGQLVTIISNNCEASGNCGLRWACAKTRHCNEPEGAQRHHPQQREETHTNPASSLTAKPTGAGRVCKVQSKIESAFLNRLSPSCKALLKHCETRKTMCPLCTRLARRRPFPGEELRLSPRCQSDTVACRHRSGAKARNQARSLALFDLQVG